MLESLIAPIANIHYSLCKKREAQIGYALRFRRLAPDWINSIMLFDMSRVWKKYGLAAIGMNYFTIGSVKNGLSTRFDSASPLYQSWLGGYTVRFAKPREWKPEDHFQLGVADQKNWLRYYGDPHPYAEVDAASPKNRGTMKIGRYTGTVYEGSIRSDTDVGNGWPFLPLPLVMSASAFHFNKNNPTLHITYRNFVPSWKNGNELLTPYQKIILKGYVVIIPVTSDTSAMLYANGCEFTTKNGKHINHFLSIKKTLLRGLRNTEIIKL